MYHSTYARPEGNHVIACTFWGDDSDTEASRRRGGIFLTQVRPDETTLIRPTLGSPNGRYYHRLDMNGENLMTGAPTQAAINRYGVFNTEDEPVDRKNNQVSSLSTATAQTIICYIHRTIQQFI